MSIQISQCESCCCCYIWNCWNDDLWNSKLVDRHCSKTNYNTNAIKSIVRNNLTLTCNCNLYLYLLYILFVALNFFANLANYKCIQKIANFWMNKLFVYQNQRSKGDFRDISFSKTCKKGNENIVCKEKWSK